MSADKAVVGLRHGGLTAEMAPLLTSESILRCVDTGWEGMLVNWRSTARRGTWPVEVARIADGVVAIFEPTELIYIGERGEDGWIACPEGGWTSNPVPGRSIGIRCAGDGGIPVEDVSPRPSEMYCWGPLGGSTITAFRLSDQQAAEPASAPVGIREADEPKAPAQAEGALGDLVERLEKLRDDHTKPQPDDPPMPWHVLEEAAQAIRQLSREPASAPAYQGAQGEALAEIISDEEIIKVHANANFGSLTPREVVNDGVRKTAVGYHCGHMQFTILREHGLITKPRPGRYDADLTKKGNAYARVLFLAALQGRSAADLANGGGT